MSSFEYPAIQLMQVLSLGDYKVNLRLQIQTGAEKVESTFF